MEYSNQSSAKQMLFIVYLCQVILHGWQIINTNGTGVVQGVVGQKDWNCT